jgi:hypothetical protein
VPARPVHRLRGSSILPRRLRRRWGTMRA